MRQKGNCRMKALRRDKADWRCYNRCHGIDSTLSVRTYGGVAMSTLLSGEVGSIVTRAGYRNIFKRVLRGFALHRCLYVMALFTFGLGLAVAPISGNWPDFEIVGTFLFYLLIATLVGCLAGLIIKFVRLALFEKPKSPTRALIEWTRQSVLNGDRVSNTVHSFLPLVIFNAGFGILKGAIGLLHPFSWDRSLRDLDIALSGGRMPHEWLEWLTASPTAVYLINFNYNLWFFVVLGAYFVVGMAAKNSVNRMRFLNAFFLLWLVAGVFVAFVFSSAGPVYFERLGLGTDYAPLMDSLHMAAKHFSIWALSTQDVLWDGYTGIRGGSAGIAAFPSLHVGTSVLVALCATRAKSRLAVPAWIFAGGILLGSVVLGWHYVVDGYAGALFALVMWKIASCRPFVRGLS